MDQTDRKRPNPKISSKKFERLQWDPNLRERRTTTDYLASALRAAIYDGQFVDNEELNQVELAEFFGVSRVPVREALRQLQAEGLVQSIAHHRTVVSGMTLPQILEAIEMRAALEAHLLRKAAKRFDSTDILKLRQIAEEGSKIKDYGSRWVLKNWEFHRTLYGRAESPTIIDAVERIQLKVERYTRRTGSKERLRQAASEHRQILAAIEQNNVEKASALLEEHILNSGEAVRWKHEETSARQAVRPAAAKKQKGRSKPEAELSRRKVGSTSKK